MERHKQFIRDAGCKPGGPQLDTWSRGHTFGPLASWPLASWLLALGAAMVAGGIWWGLS